MPAINPRLTITLKPTTAAQLKALSELTGQSQSSLIAELLETNEPVFTRLITVLQAAETAKVALTQEMRAGLGEAQDKIEQQLGLVLGIADDALALAAAQAGAPLLEEAERVQRRGARKAGGRAAAAPRTTAAARAVALNTTPPSNRGVRSTPKTPKKSTRTRG